jgi:tRNA G46 methylase TrmB
MRVRTHTNPFNYYQRLQPIDWSSLWSEFDGTLDFEIGFGRGVFFVIGAKNIQIDFWLVLKLGVVLWIYYVIV